MTVTNGSGAVEIVGTAQHAAWGAKTLPPVERVAGGLWSVPVPIPDNPLRYTLSYLVPAEDGLVVVDPGWDSAEGWEALRLGLAGAGAEPADVTGIVVTHIHPDHHGLSGRLRAESGAWIAMHPAERDTLPQRAATAAGPDGAQVLEAWLLRCGADHDDVGKLLATMQEVAQTPTATWMAEPDVLLEDGDLVPLPGRRLRAVWTPGHTPGHLCLQELDALVLLTGDHLLPRITPNIGMHPGADDPALAQFMTSLDRMSGFDDHDALPAHEYRFRGLAARARQLREHHDRRCAEVLRIVAALETPTLWRLAQHLTWSRPWAEVGGPMVFGAIAETGAHVRYLVDRGELAWSAGPHDPTAGSTGPARVRLAGVTVTR